MTNWPSFFPNPVTTFTGTVDKTAKRVDMESGRTRQLATATVARRVFSVAWQLTDKQLQVFRAFLYWRLNNGTDFFTMGLPFGEGFNQTTVRFINGQYTFTPDQNAYWRVTAQLEGYDA